MMTNPVTVAVTSPYLLYFGDIWGNLALIKLCEQLTPHQIVIISDANVAPLYGHRLQVYLQHQGWSVAIVTVPAGEHAKSRAVKAFVEDRLLDLSCGRDTVLLALGGGVVTDLAGFVAATYCRGIPVIYVPTSLLGMVDSAIGGKTGINVPHAKNWLGTITSPKAVFIDSQFLSSLPDTEYYLAFPEIIKHALIADANYFDWIVQHTSALKKRVTRVLDEAIKQSCLIKARIVARDEKDHASRVSLNLGHTFAHAIETVSDYQVPHGQAVAFGLMAAAYLSHCLGLLNQDDVLRIQSLLNQYMVSIDAQTAKRITVTALQSVIARDKKSRHGIPRFVLLEKIGKVACQLGRYAIPVDPVMLEAALSYCQHHWSQTVDSGRMVSE